MNKSEKSGSLKTLLTARQVAERLGVAVGTVYNWVHFGQLQPAARLNGYNLRFDIEAVDALLVKPEVGRRPYNRRAAHGT